MAKISMSTQKSLKVVTSPSNQLLTFLLQTVMQLQNMYITSNSSQKEYDALEPNIAPNWLLMKSTSNAQHTIFSSIHLNWLGLKILFKQELHFNMTLHLDQTNILGNCKQWSSSNARLYLLQSSNLYTHENQLKK